MTATEWPGRCGRGGRVLLLACLVLLSGFAGLSLSRVASAAGPPHLEILSPLDGSVVGNGTPVTVQLIVSNFTLVQPGRVGQIPTANEGHAIVFLDGALVRLVTDAAPFSLSVTSGSHVILAELVLDNGTPLTPVVTATAHIVATMGPAVGTPTIAILSPKALETTGHGFWLTFAITNFTLVAPRGQPNAPNEGHIQLLIYGSVVLEFSSYEPVILVAMPDGDVNIAARLVNNNNTRLNPDAFVTIPIHVTASSAVSLPLIINGGSTLLLGFTLIVLIVRRRHLEREATKESRGGG